jgi:predicted SAM-dependent methyltransferase
VTAIEQTGAMLAFPGAAAPRFQAVAADASGLPDLAGVAEGSAALFALRGIEHWTEDLARTALSRIRYVLRPGGVLRVVTPDLDTAVLDYLFGQVEADSGLTRGQRFNLWQHAFGTGWIYNEEDLTAMLQDVGFADIRRFTTGSGSERPFWDLDSGEAGLLVLEARRTKAAWP